MAGYTKLFGELIYSTIWMESDPVRILWITMLALKDDRHEVMASIPGLAKAASISVEDCEAGIEKFLNPDPYSRSKDFDGRRIEECKGGWRILNGEEYRSRRNEEDRREYQRQWAAEKREKERAEKAAAAQKKKQVSANTDGRKKNGSGMVIPTQEEIQAFTDKNGLSLNVGKLFNFYTSNGWKVGKNPMKDWQAAVRGWVERDRDDNVKKKPEGQLQRAAKALNESRLARQKDQKKIGEDREE